MYCLSFAPAFIIVSTLKGMEKTPRFVTHSKMRILLLPQFAFFIFSKEIVSALLRSRRFYDGTFTLIEIFIQQFWFLSGFSALLRVCHDVSFGPYTANSTDDELFLLELPLLLLFHLSCFFILHLSTPSGFSTFISLHANLLSFLFFPTLSSTLQALLYPLPLAAVHPLFSLLLYLRPLLLLLGLLSLFLLAPLTSRRSYGEN